MVWEENSFKEFQDGHHRPSWISEWNDLSNSESHVATITSTKFQLNPTYGSGDVKNVKS